jgi:hypothetical protein
MTRWIAEVEYGGVMIERASVGGCDLEVMRVDDKFRWLVRQDGRHVAENIAADLIEARHQAEAVARMLGL